MSKNFYAIERFVLPRNQVSLKITPCSSRKEAEEIIGNSEAQITAVSSFGTINPLRDQEEDNERL